MPTHSAGQWSMATNAATCHSLMIVVGGVGRDIDTYQRRRIKKLKKQRGRGF